MCGHLQVNSEWFLRRSMFLYSTWHGQDRVDPWAFGSTSASFRQGFWTSDVLQSNRTCCAGRQQQKWKGDASTTAWTTASQHIELQDITLTLKKRHGSNSSILRVHCRFQEGHRHILCIVFLCLSYLCFEMFCGNWSRFKNFNVLGKWNWSS